MKLMLRSAVLLLLIALVPAEVAFSGVQKPIRDPENCVECTLDQETGGAVCGEVADWGDPSNWLCTGGLMCWDGADGTRVCQPNCGSRCYSI